MGTNTLKDIKNQQGLLGWIYKQIVVEKFNNVFGFIVLTLMCVGLAVVITQFGTTLGVLVMGGVIGVPIAIYGLINNRFALVLMTVVPAFLPFIVRLIGSSIQFGIAIDAFLLLLFLGKLVQAAFSKEFKTTIFKTAIGTVIIIWTAYVMIQVVNPSGSMSAWAFGIREVIRFLIIFIIADGAFNSKRFLKRYTNIWLVMAFIIALYGLVQEFLGLTSFELAWANATPERINLLFIAGKWRKWSFLSDPAVFGLLMSFGGIVAIILSLGAFKTRIKLFYAFIGLIMFLAMLYSGTRTAYVIIPIGFMLYVLMNIGKVRTLVFTSFAFGFFLILYFGPFYNKTLHRMRTAFNPSEDASFNLRDYNRALIRPYVHSHPIGGGLATSGVNGERFAPWHRLAGFPPDSGFMKTMIELGWIGLFLRLTMYFTILAVGVTNYYRIRDPILKSYLSAFIIAFFALTIALIAKENIEQFPLNFILYCIFVCMYKIKDFDTVNSKPIQS